MKWFEHLHILWQLAIALVFGVLLFFFLMSAVFLIPYEAVEPNAAASADILKAEGYDYAAFFPNNAKTSSINNYTCYEMVRIARGHSYDRAIVNAMSCDDYAIYWHGCTVFLRPLLLLGGIDLIRYCNIILFSLLLYIVLSAMQKRLQPAIPAAFLLSLLLTWVFLIPLSPQGLPSYVLMLLACLLLIKQFSRLNRKRLCLLFFAVGMLTSFFDLLATPLLTWGYPLLMLFALELSDKDAREQPSLLQFVRLSVCWVSGYGLCWASKWVLGSLVLKKNIVADALTEASYRMNEAPLTETGHTSINRLEVLEKNLTALLPNSSAPVGTVFIAFAVILLLFTAALLLTKRRNKSGTNTPPVYSCPFCLRHSARTCGIWCSQTIPSCTTGSRSGFSRLRYFRSCSC